MATENMKKQRNGTMATPGFEAQLWASAGAVCNNMDLTEYKHIAPARIQP